MFSLHERTQRKICRTAFVALCVVPTFATLSWVVYFHRPWHERDWQRALESELHVQVEIGEVSAPRPLQRAIGFVKLTDLRSSEPMLEVRGVETIKGGPTSFETINVDNDQLQRLAEAAQIWLRGASVCDAKWQCEELAFVSATDGEWKLKEITCETRVSSNGLRQCLIRAIHNGKPIRLSIECSSDGKLQTVVDARQVELPAWLLADTLPGASRWQDASILGVFQLEAERSEVHGKFQGSVDAIDTKSWIGNGLLQATATLRLENLTWCGDRLESVQGTLEATQGMVSNTFLLLLKEKFLCTLAVDESQLTDSEQLRPIDGLGCQFKLNSEGLAISGTFTWGETEKGCVITADGKPLASVPAMSTLPLAQIVQLVSEHSPYWVPATREAIDLGERLPLPKSGTLKK